ncbi:MAG TPA: hypothetical protein VFQ97_01935 [Gallionella sp.]|nr:hypothetical protein [Gallionella sp.]
MTELCVPLRGAFIKGAATPRQYCCLLSSVLCLLSSALCCAEELPDPTRPPASFAAPGAAPGHGVIESQPSGLQSTIISESRRAAIIDGKTVEQGAKHGNARLIEVNEGSVVLLNEQTRRVLTLFPDVKITRRNIKTKNASPQSEAKPEEISTMPAAEDEKLLSVHPKEEK